ncbi:enoyl-CoA hydratase/isomerase family protein [Mycobacterium intracellulare 1956]|uniref:Enoyl-CoA hydratase/isomerase family protein n=1 Tax=Mycobacterium intracellulare 1956 TaxID=1299331 RepID=X8CM59_MYCIT|nr:enoyl-CoA hydratase/isomerase family protein [Mycobacterium intracellulare 1956]
MTEAPANEETGPDALVEQRGHTLIVTMNRPHRRNALSTEMMEIMVQAWDRVDNDPDIRCCILTGAGGYFCAGMDLKAATQKPPGESFKDGSYDPSRIDALLKGRRLKKPLIAAVEGPAIAGVRRSCRAPTSGWPARAPNSASPRPSGACTRWAGPRCDWCARFPTPWRATCC